MRKRPTVTATQILNLIKEQNYQCAISGRPLTPETVSLDHIVPLSRGGEHSLANIWAVDYQVNTAKGTLTMEEFVILCRDVLQNQNQTKVASREVVEQRESGEPPK